MVPSWTETLINCGVDVVGRTRYCIHPHNQIKIVGGTKDWNLDLIRSLNPDFILLDQEENTKEMFTAWPEKCLVTHVEKLADVSRELIQLAQRFENQNLLRLSERWQKLKPVKCKEIPGVLKWIRKPQGEIKNIAYVIWKNPWMAVSPNTFIASMLSHVGFGSQIQPNSKKYYEFEMKDLPPQTLILFSSEPFPFLKKQEGLEFFGDASAIVDGESYSWFGMRSLEFLEKLS